MKSHFTWIALALCTGICAWELWFDAPVENAYLWWEFRWPRVLGGLMAGATLALSGLFLQTLFRNPLAGPFLIGISPGATLAMALGLFGIEQYQGVQLSLNGQIALALLGAFAALALQLFLSRRQRSTESLLLIGMVLSFAFGAATDLLQNLASAERLKMFSLWNMGSFERLTLAQLPGLAILLTGLMGLAFWRAAAMDSFLLGDTYAQSGGLSLKQMRGWLIAGGAAGAAWITALCGPISFIGLVAPHIARELLGSGSHRRLWIHSAIWGSFLALSADFLAHHLLPHHLLQVNAVSALIGAPVLLYSLLRQRH
ncbi:MAG: FecCD family ABC transporter permease [Bacteroidia bacterium]